MKECCWILTGPTASGKSSLALKLAQKCGCEIVCMDSMQIYRGMDIGTAKPTIAEQSLIPHHMLDICDPREPYSVAQYTHDAEECAHEILSRGKIPLFVGGTGFYLRALRHPMALGNAAANPGIRQHLQQIADESEDGAALLHRMLENVDNITAARLPVNDTRRVIRALEVYQVTGLPFSKQEQSAPPAAFSFRTATLDMDRALLYERIEQRVDEMISLGLGDEVAGLISHGVSPECQAMKGIGYKEMVPYIQGKCTLDDAKNEIKLNTRHYAKRQLTWMRREEDVLWVNPFSSGAWDELLKFYEEKDE